jgi:hypothetical protein
VKKLVIITFAVLFSTALLICSNLTVSRAQKSDKAQTDLVEPTPCDDKPQNCPCVSPTPRVTGVSFEEVGGDLSPAPAGQDGERIYADKNNAGDTTNRRAVLVRAYVQAPLNCPDYKVVFKAYDVDDPSSDTTIDPNDTTGPTGNDNRLPGGALTAGPGLFSHSPTGPTAASTDSIDGNRELDGTFTAYFHVTTQPGNNAVIAATTGHISELNAVTIDGTGLRDGAGVSLPTNRIKRTNLLTTWRRLHIETDSMSYIFLNKITGTTGTAIDALPRNRTAVIDVTPSPNIALETNRFENGRLVSGSTSLVVTGNTATTVTVKNTSWLPVTLPANSSFEMVDDDDWNDSDLLLLDGDNVGLDENLPNPDFSLMTEYGDNTYDNIFAAAYVHPVYDIGDDNENVPTVTNVMTNNPIDIRQHFDIDHQDGDDNFWTIYVLGSYQYTLTRDNDPNSENAISGVVDAVTDVTGEGTGAMIFIEIHRAAELTGYISNPQSTQSLANTVAHEVSHLLSCQHGQGEIMGVGTDGVPASSMLSSAMIHRIRSLDHP